MYASPYRVESHPGRLPDRARAVVLALLSLASSLCAPRSVNAQPADAADVASAPVADAATDAPAPQLTRAPELTKFVPAVVPSGAEPLLEPRTVVLELTVNADGSVSDVVVHTSVDGARDAAAMEAVGGFEFKPAELDGAPAAVRLKYEYVFEPEAGAAPDPAVATPEEPSASEPPAAPASDPVAPPASGRLEGRTLQSGTRKPLIGATVSLPDLGMEALTDAEGRFHFDGVPAGEVRIVLSDAGHGRVEDTERVERNAVTEVTYYAEQTGFGDDDLVAVGRRARKEVVRRELSIQEIKTVPGSNGDALKAVQNLPGVARASGGNLVLRGGGGSRVYLNGHPIPAAFHFGDLRSTVGNGMIESLDVTPGNYDARFGSANGGVVDVQTRRPASDGLHGFGQVDLYDGSAFLEGPVGEHGVLAVGARRSYIDGVMNLVLDEEAKESFPSAPRYYDYQAIYDWKNGKHRLRANLFGSTDSMVLLLDAPDSEPAAHGNLTAKSSWVTGQLLWDYRVDDRTRVHNSFSYLRTDMFQRLGMLKLDIAQDHFTWRSELSREVTPWLTLRSGVHAQMQHSTFDVVAPPPPREGQREPNLSLQEALQAEGSASVYNPALFVASELQLGPVLAIPAVRLEHFSHTDTLKGDLLVQPRLDARWAITDGTTAKAGVGLYSAPADLPQSNDVFGNPEVEPEKSVHYSLGAEQRITSAVSLDVTGFYKDLYHQISPVDDPQVRFDNRGKGRAYGAEVLLKHDLHSRFYGWVAYTIMRSERMESGQSEYRLFDLDQTHNLNVVGQYRLSRTWELGSRFRFITGNPSTPVRGAIYDSDADTFAPLYEPTNSARLGNFHQLDVRVDKHWIFDTWRMTTYLDIQNIYNRKNPEAVVYNHDFSESLTQGGLPIFPSFGARGEF